MCISMMFSLTTPTLDLKRDRSVNSVVSVDLEEFFTSKVSARGKRLAVGSLRAFVILPKLSNWAGGTGT